MLTRCKPLLGTLVEISVPEAAAGTVDRAFAAIADIHARMSFHAKDSDLAVLRQAPLGVTVEVAPETVKVLRVALDLYLPRPEGPMWSRQPGTSADIEIIDDCRVRCHKAMLIDLGGIAKGFAVDRAVAALQAGVEKVSLVDGRVQHSVLLEIFTDEGVGTEVVL